MVVLEVVISTASNYRLTEHEPQLLYAIIIFLLFLPLGLQFLMPGVIFGLKHKLQVFAVHTEHEL